MATLSVIRRWALREQMSIREISRRTGLARNTAKKYLRAGDELHFSLCACGSGAKLRTADKYAASLKSSVAGLQALVDDQAGAVRIATVALVVSPAAKATAAQKESFKGLACEALLVRG